jgi:protein SCO1/2
MSRNFSDAALKIMDNAEYRDKFRLLSISFDPTRDTPAKLREYGKGYLGNPDKPDFTVWQLAVGPEKDIRNLADFFGLKYEIDPTDQANFNHSLVTAIISPEGKVVKILNGNRWSTEELITEMRSATGQN